MTSAEKLHVLLIGSEGQLGSDLLRVANDFPDLEIHPFDLPELDVTKADRVNEIINRVHPDWIVNLAAFHEVERCEVEFTRAFDVNAQGAQNVARAAANNNAKVVFLSTDYVFSGLDRNFPYTEDDQPGPKSIYAASKLAGEKLTLNLAPGSLVVRSCGLYGETPPKAKATNFVTGILSRARKKDPLRVVSDQICTPTWTRPLAQTALACLVSPTPLSGVIHATCQGQCSWHEFATAILDEAEIKADVAAISSEQFGAKVKRPPYSVLDNTRLRQAGLDRLPPWREALKDYMQRLRERGL